MKGSRGNFPLTWKLIASALWLVSSVLSVNSAQYDLYSARIVVNYTDPSTKNMVSKELAGRFGVSSPTATEVGLLVHVLTEDALNHGCTPAVNAPTASPWIALIQRGNCKFEHKINNAVVKNNASAVIIYNHKAEDTLITMDHSGECVQLHCLRFYHVYR